MKLQLLSLLAIATQILAKNVGTIPGYHSLAFDITRGTSFETSSKLDKSPKLIKRAVDGTVDLEIENETTFYSVSLKIGSEEEQVTVLIDTGSSDLWVSSASNTYCIPGTAGGSSSSRSSSRSNSKYRDLIDEEEFLNALKSQGADIDDLKKKRWVILEDNDAETSGSDSDGLNNLISGPLINKAGEVPTSSQVDCSKFGTFDETKSTTFTSNNTAFSIVYGDRTFALGNWGYDNVNVGGLQVDNLSFAVANQSNSTMGVLGIGLQGLETTNSGSLARNNPYTYSNLPIKLVEDGLINTPAYSLYLNDYSASSGNVLFGGVDHAKYEGDLQLIPIINSLAGSNYKEPIQLEITLNSVSLNGNGQQSVQVFQGESPALLDSGTTLTYLPSDIVSSIGQSLGAQYSSQYGYYMLSCPSPNSNINITYNFQGININVPLSEVVLQADNTGSTCALAMIASDKIILGDSFLRSAYVVYDLANYQIGLAQVKYTDEENIEVITDRIPSATAAAGYSSTAAVTESSATGGVIGWFTSVFGSPSATSSGTSRPTGAATRSGASATATASSTRAQGTAAAGAANMLAVPGLLGVIMGLGLLF